MVSVVIATFEIRIYEDPDSGWLSANHCFVDSINWETREELEEALTALLSAMVIRAEEENETEEEPLLRSLNIQHFLDRDKKFS